MSVNQACTTEIDLPEAPSLVTDYDTMKGKYPPFVCSAVYFAEQTLINLGMEFSLEEGVLDGLSLRYLERISATQTLYPTLSATQDEMTRLTDPIAEILNQVSNGTGARALQKMVTEIRSNKGQRIIGPHLLEQQDFLQLISDSNLESGSSKKKSELALVLFLQVSLDRTFGIHAASIAAPIQAFIDQTHESDPDFIFLANIYDDMDLENLDKKSLEFLYRIRKVINCIQDPTKRVVFAELLTATLKDPQKLTLVATLAKALKGSDVEDILNIWNSEGFKDVMPLSIIFLLDEVVVSTLTIFKKYSDLRKTLPKGQDTEETFIARALELYPCIISLNTLRTALFSREARNESKINELRIIFSNIMLSLVNPVRKDRWLRKYLSERGGKIVGNGTLISSVYLLNTIDSLSAKIFPDKAFKHKPSH